MHRFLSCEVLVRCCKYIHAYCHKRQSTVKPVLNTFEVINVFVSLCKPFMEYKTGCQESEYASTLKL